MLHYFIEVLALRDWPIDKIVMSWCDVQGLKIRTQWESKLLNSNPLLRLTCKLNEQTRPQAQRIEASARHEKFARSLSSLRIVTNSQLPHAWDLQTKIRGKINYDIILNGVSYGASICPSFYAHLCNKLNIEQSHEPCSLKGRSFE